MAVEFRFARIDEYPAIASFLDEYWAKEHIYVRDRALFDWTFRRASVRDDRTYSFAVGEEHGELVGILGGIPFTLNTFGKESKAVWIVNYVIRPDHRRGACALQLLSMFRKGPFEGVIAFGINPATAAIYKVLRGQVLDNIPRHFIVLPNAADRASALLALTYPHWSAEQCASLATTFQCRGIPEESVASSNTLPSDWDHRYWPTFAKVTVGASRDINYLHWRYTSHPTFDYRFIVVAEGDAVGLAVWRLETIRQQTDARRVDLELIGRLVDFLPVSRNNAHKLLNCFLREICVAGAFGADYYGYHGPSRVWLEEAGFVPVTKHPEGNSIPSRFQPLDGKGGGIMSAMILQQQAPSCSQGTDCLWHWTKSDSDQDRPN